MKGELSSSGALGGEVDTSAILRHPAARRNRARAGRSLAGDAETERPRPQPLMPPEASMRWPLIHPLASSSSSAMAPPMSSGRPTRPRGVWLAII